MHEHHVIVYVKKNTKTFSATARKSASRLDEVNDWAKKHGYKAISIAAGIDKVSAEA